jgi:hypothetical protein
MMFWDPDTSNFQHFRWCSFITPHRTTLHASQDVFETTNPHQLHSTNCNLSNKSRVRISIAVWVARAKRF